MISMEAARSDEVWHACCDEVLIHTQQFAAITRWRKSSLQKNIHRADGNKSPKKQQECARDAVSRSPTARPNALNISASLCLPPLSLLCLSTQHSTAMTGQLILTLSPSIAMTARAAGSRSLALRALGCARPRSVAVCRRARPR